jgi:hypothetical protein
MGNHTQFGAYDDANSDWIWLYSENGALGLYHNGINVASTTTTGLSAGTFTGALSGNATTASTLQTARTINGVSFNGSANITVTANTPNTLTRGSYLTGSNFNGSAATTWAVDATSANTASKVVARDASGNFSAGTVTAALSGNATTASTLQTARTIGGVSFNGSANINLPGVNTTGNQNTTGSAATLTTARTIALGGDVTGSASFNGSANITITATVADDSHNHVISNVDGLQTALDAKLALAGGTMTGNVRGSVHTASVTGTVTVNLTTYNSFVYTLTGNITLANPTTEDVGQSGVFVFIHSGAARTVSLGTDFETVGGGGLTLSSASGATDIVPYYVAASGRIILGTPQLGFV